MNSFQYKKVIHAKVSSLRLYHYCSNNPMSYTDPDGRLDCGIFDNQGNYTQKTMQDNNHLQGILIRVRDSYKTINNANKYLRGKDTLIIYNKFSNDFVAIPVSSVANMEGTHITDTLSEQDFTLTYDPFCDSKYVPDVFTISKGNLIPMVPYISGESLKRDGTTITNKVPWRGHNTSFWGSEGCITAQEGNKSGDFMTVIKKLNEWGIFGTYDIPFSFAKIYEVKND